MDVAGERQARRDQIEAPQQRRVHTKSVARRARSCSFLSPPTLSVSLSTASRLLSLFPSPSSLVSSLFSAPSTLLPSPLLHPPTRNVLLRAPPPRRRGLPRPRHRLRECMRCSPCPAALIWLLGWVSLGHLARGHDVVGRRPAADRLLEGRRRRAVARQLWSQQGLCLRRFADPAGELWCFSPLALRVDGYIERPGLEDIVFLGLDGMDHQLETRAAAVGQAKRECRFSCASPALFGSVTLASPSSVPLDRDDSVSGSFV